MRQAVKGFHHPIDEEFSSIWRNCLFILDTNVLLNIYRYDKSARDELLNTFTSITARLWVPFQAALEFQRNRPKVIADQKKKFVEVRNVVAKVVPQLENELGKLQLKKRHSLISTERLTDEISLAIDKFNSNLDQIEKMQIDVYTKDELRDQIETLFVNKVGLPPSVEWMEKLILDGNYRFKHKFPPGYSDGKKSSDTELFFTYGGILYEKKYGDLIIWQQIIDYSAALAGHHIIFITDDGKEDWWWSVDSGGPKRLGPRPELVEEMLRVGKASSFYMYRSETFLEYANKYLEVVVSNRTIEEVRKVSSQRRAETSGKKEINTVHDSVLNWLAANFSGYSFPIWLEMFPDIILVSPDEKRIGVEYIMVDEEPLSRILTHRISELSSAMISENLDECLVLAISPKSSDFSKINLDSLRSALLPLPDKLSFYIGEIKMTGKLKDDPIFFPRAIIA